MWVRYRWVGLLETAGQKVCRVAYIPHVRAWESERGKESIYIYIYYIIQNVIKYIRHTYTDNWNRMCEMRVCLLCTG